MASNLPSLPFNRTLLVTVLLGLALFALGARANGNCEDKLVAHHHADLDSYISGMEKSSLQKAALGSLGRPGRLADLGTGSGVSAHDLAVLFPDSTVTGVDLDPGMVAYAQSHYAAPNLKYIAGDAEHTNFPPNSLDTIFISSTLHHLTSYGSGHFDTAHVHSAIQAARAQLKTGGVLVLRDFVIPEGPNQVIMEIPEADGTVALFERFAQDFRSSQHREGGVPFQELARTQSGWRRFQLSLRDANEFILRKDYREAYSAEIKEEYTFMTQKEFEHSLELSGFRILHSAPIYNPWIIQNRYEGKVHLFDLGGKPVPFPPTNYIIAGEKVGPGQGIRLREASRLTASRPEFLRTRAVQEIKTGKIFDLVERPGAAVDLIPYFTSGGRLYVLGKQGFPRPIATVDDGAALSSFNPRGYVIEPLSFLVDRSQPLFAQVDAQLGKRGGLSEGDLVNQQPLTLHRLYTSPGLADETTTAMALEIHARPIQLLTPTESYSAFSTSGVVRPLEATQILRAAQVGAILDARLEVAVYQLLRALHRDLGPWIGEEISLQNTLSRVQTSAAAAVLDPPKKTREFRAVSADKFGTFLEIRRSQFSEEDAMGNSLAQQTLEYVVPKAQSTEVVSVLPVFKRDGRIFVGLEHRHLPAVQLAEGYSDLVTVPAWRLPKSIANLTDAKAFIGDALARDFAVRGGRLIELGGMYQSSKGLSPETVSPMLVEVEPSPNSQLAWVALDDLIVHRGLIKDAHLMISAMRAAHALQIK